jgi:hypothetical protein
MSDVPERLFRDDQGAAIERVARLEDENRRLRDELEQLRGGRPIPEDLPHRAPPSPLPAAVAALIAGMLMLGGLLTTFSGHGPHRRVRPPRYTNIVVPPAQPVLTHPADADCADPFYTDSDGSLRVKTQCAPEAAKAGPLDDCSTPFWVDTRGIRHYKRQCVFGH